MGASPGAFNGGVGFNVQIWQQLIDTAKQLKTTIAYTNAQYEGTTVWFNSVIQSAGGSILNNEGGVGLGPPGLKAITIMHDFAAGPANAE